MREGEQAEIERVTSELHAITRGVFSRRTPKLPVGNRRAGKAVRTGGENGPERRQDRGRQAP